MVCFSKDVKVSVKVRRTLSSVVTSSSNSRQCTDQSWMTDQMLSGNGQHQRWAASGNHRGERLVREVTGSRGAAEEQQGGDVD